MVRLSSLQCVQPDSESLSSHDPLLTVQHAHRTHLLSLQSQTLITTDDTTNDSSYNQHSSLWRNAAFLICFLRGGSRQTASGNGEGRTALVSLCVMV
ncbi:hypothetical protein G5714_007645 [Onychostoma macrolepis]|uniref:Uncharacterized protein n=1 Tax=Onychostoma macrolepis TaxID=369639 RepID=A0A7J6CUB4_9TELE|nr:hypothetical protein G5714_007645 [Onychostoma macrolepis]